MPSHEQVVLALVRIRVTHQATLRAHRLKLWEASGDQLVRVDLMPRVPNQTVVGEVKCLVQSQAKFDHSKIRREMSTSATDKIAEHLAHFGRQLFELR